MKLNTVKIIGKYLKVHILSLLITVNHYSTIVVLFRVIDNIYVLKKNGKLSGWYLMDLLKKKRKNFIYNQNFDRKEKGNLRE